MSISIIDFSECKYSDKHGIYGGASGRKDGIVYNGERWIIKYPRSTTKLKKTNRYV